MKYYTGGLLAEMVRAYAKTYVLVLKAKRLLVRFQPLPEIFISKINISGLVLVSNGWQPIDSPSLVTETHSRKIKHLTMADGLINLMPTPRIKKYKYIEKTPRII